MDTVVFAIPNNKNNNQLKKHLYKINANVFLGSETTFLKEFFMLQKNLSQRM